MTPRLRLGLLALLLAAAGGCTGDSALPDPTGKGTVRAVNAIQGGPDIRYLIEETALESLAYKAASNGRRWDDFEYRFNFEASFLGETAPRRIASQLLKVDASRDYTFVITGTVNSPTVTLWEGDERSFDEGATVFEVRFAHVAPSLGDADVYIDAPGTAPVPGAARGTVSFGDLLPPLDIEAGDYVLTVTAAGDPAAVLYQSATAAYAERTAYIIPVFEGDELDVAPYDVRRINSAGGSTRLPDVRFPPTVRLVQASIDLAAADVYEDEMLTVQLLSNHVFGDITGDLPAAVGENNYFYTPTGDTMSVLFESMAAFASGTHNNFIVAGTEGSRTGTAYVPNRRSVSTVARVNMYHGAENHEFLDLYVLDAGETVDDATRSAVLGFGTLSPTLSLDTGVYDLYLTVLDEKTIVDGPVQLDLALGDVAEGFIFDTVDPATADLVFPPAP